MDKETLSNYGWIVICVLILTVLLALASPFGNFIAGAIKSTTAGLFNVNQEALGVVGVGISDQGFPCEHLNSKTIPAEEATAEHPAYGAYTVCDDCGELIDENGKIIESGEIPYQYTNFTITYSNLAEIGYTRDTKDLVIPGTFRGSDGTWYKVIGIGNSSFYSCYNLTSITIPDTVTSIGSSSFNNCRSLTSVTIPDSVTSIGTLAFCGCVNLTSINIPKSVTTIGDSTFADCEKLTSITIPDSVTNIGFQAFRNCANLTSITIPNSVTTIGDNAFQQCDNLTSVTIPDSATSIGKDTFSYCDNLTSITIPNSLTSIGTKAFYSCSNLNIIIFNGTIEQWNNISKVSDWNYQTGDVTVQCTDGCLEIWN